MSLQENAADFLDYLDNWLAHLPAAALDSVIQQPAATAVLCVDMINGFCTRGPLSSPRVQGIAAPIARLFSAAHAHGVRHFVLPQDTHDPQAVEFSHYPAHAVRGDVESQTVPELSQLPFATDYIVIEKNSISSSENTALDAWLDAHPQVNTLIVTGDCSDLCTYQLAMHLRLRANAAQREGVRVIVPADCVQTYDTPVDVAQRLGIPAHGGDLLHAVFLYNMACNGVEVVRSLT
jgi:nicotinamidase-related amidase